MNDFEIFRKPADKSSVICFSPQYLNSLIPRRSVSPKRYCLGTDNLESYKSSNLSNRSSRSSYCQNYLSGIRSSDNIKKFSDIKLKNYNKKEKCQGDNPAYDRTVKGTLEDDLFKQYAENLKQMLKSTV